jgi:hypothetical protein
MLAGQLNEALLPTQNMGNLGAANVGANLAGFGFPSLF